MPDLLIVLVSSALAGAAVWLYLKWDNACTRREAEFRKAFLVSLAKKTGVSSLALDTMVRQSHAVRKLASQARDMRAAGARVREAQWMK